MCYAFVFILLVKIPAQDIERHASDCGVVTATPPPPRRIPPPRPPPTQARHVPRPTRPTARPSWSHQPPGVTRRPDDDIVSQCPICSKHFPVTLLPGHANICLMNSEIC